MKKIILPALALLGAYMPAAADDVMQIYKADGSVIDIPVGDVSRVTVLEDENAALIFEDDFDQESRIPNEAVWELCPQSTPAWTRHLSNSYDEAYVEDGKLVLLAHVVDGKARCGGIQMKGSSAFKYGRVEVYARFTQMAQGTWPAIWMMPSSPTWSGWPQCGEIDIMEHLNTDGNVWNVIHDNYTDNLGHSCSTNPRVTTADWHTYRVDWTPEYIQFYVDDKKTLEYKNLHLEDEATHNQWPFDAPFYLILNNAIGDYNGTSGAWPGAYYGADAKFEIDWVKVTEIVED